MNPEKEINPISAIIFKEIVGKASADEIEQLDKWRDEEPENEIVYNNLHNAEKLHSEYMRYKMINTENALNKFKAVIAQDRKKRIKFIINRVSRVAAVVAFAFIGLFLLNEQVNFLGNRENAPKQQIRHGNVKAILTLGSGEAIALDDSKKVISDDDAVIVKGDNGSLTYSNKIHVQNKSLKFNDLFIPRGGEFSMVLSDGTKVWLNAETKFRFPVCFVGDERRVILEGEAYFKVAKGTRPFIVESQGQIVKVYGTEFNISAYASDHLVYTTLIEGHVGIMADQGDSIVDLVPGIQSAFNKNSLEINLRPVNTEEVSSWRTGMIVFEYQTLDQIMQKLSRWYDFEYQYSGIDARKLQYKGKVPRYGDFNEVLDVLESCGGIKFRVKGKVVTIIGI